MTKSKRKRASTVDVSNKVAKVLTPPETPVPKNISTLVSEEELLITVETLQSLAAYPSLLKTKQCRDLRAALFDCRQASTIGHTLTARISASLGDENYTEALVLLAEMRIRGDSPKLGALCRWVRDLDCVSGTQLVGSRSEKDTMLLRVLDAILRVTGPECTAGTSQDNGPISLQPAWDTSDEAGPVADRPIADVQFQLIERTAGEARKPPNLHPALLYLSTINTILADSVNTVKAEHPVVPNLSIIKHALSRTECRDIIAACETIGFTPDAPVRPDGQAASILAHNVYWVVDQDFHDELFRRVRPHLPELIGGKQLRGINRRFRVYRYVPGAEYRCHIDGAWPPSGVDATGGYQYDASPPGAPQSSLFTFLIYLNDEFTSGETTFFLPSVRHGVMNGYPVRPVTGSVAVFPHGEAIGALLHEGTGVTSGAKYIIRTDVEYDMLEKQASL